MSEDMTDLEAAYTDLFPQVYKYLLALCRDPDLAEELAQETFFQAIQHIDRFRGDCRLYVWLCQIGKNQYLSWLRRSKKTGRRGGTGPASEFWGPGGCASGPGGLHGPPSEAPHSAGTLP